MTILHASCGEAVIMQGLGFANDIRYQLQKRSQQAGVYVTTILKYAESTYV